MIEEKEPLLLEGEMEFGTSAGAGCDASYLLCNGMAIVDVVDLVGYRLAVHQESQELSKR